MKIYQLHEYSGAYEDARYIIVGSYLSKHRAEMAKERGEAEEKKLVELSKKCSECPFLIQSGMNLKALMKIHSSYCRYKAIDVDDEGSIFCRNFFSNYDEATFEIVEVEVDESI